MRLVRLSGLVAVAACAAMVVSDLLMLSTLEFSRALPVWEVLNGIGDRQVLRGYYLGELVLPLYLLSAGGHLALAVRPAGRWAAWLVFAGFAWGSGPLAVWHATFAFYRSLLKAGANAPATYAFEHYGWGLFAVALAVLGVILALVVTLIVSGRTLYPRWAVVFSPLVVMPLVYVAAPRASGPSSVVLMAAGWNVAGLVCLAASTAVLWNRRRA